MTVPTALIRSLGVGSGAASGAGFGARDPVGSRLSLGFATGLLVLHLLLLGATLAGVPWSRWSILGLLGSVAILAVVLRLRARTAVDIPEPLGRPGLGDLVAVGALALFAALAATGWLIFPDLVYHWGIKAGKFVLARGIDFQLLTSPTDFVLHPDYPLLLPDLIAATGLVSGAPGPWAGMVWGPVFATVTWLAARGWLAATVRSRATFQCAVAAVGLYLGFSAVAFRRATDAGWLLALALLLAAPALGRRLRRPGDALRVGIAAALAVASKLEGTPLALFLVAAAAWPGDRPEAGGGPAGRTAREWAGLLLPPLAVGLPWAALVVHYRLFAGTNWSWSSLAPERLLVVPRAMLRSAVEPLWFGFGVLTLLLVALLWLAPGMRRLAAVLSLQLGFYLAAYLATPVAVERLVETSFDRLLGHLAPVALVAAIIAADRWAGGQGGRGRPRASRGRPATAAADPATARDRRAPTGAPGRRGAGWHRGG